MKRYLQLAAEFENLITNGTLVPGVRLPSVRRASSSYRVSPSTIFQAYYTLERRGLIVARPRSGYFVASRSTPTKSLTLLSKRSIEEADGDSLIIRFMKAQRRCAHPGLGSSEPSALLFPFSRISRSLTAATRRMASCRNALSAGEAEADLRRQIALRYIVTGVTVPIDEVVVTSGALDALILCLQVLTRPGDTIAIERPAFLAVQDTVRRLRLKAVEIPVDPHLGLDLGVLEDALQQHPVRACWFMTTLQQPTGATLSDERKEALVRLLAKHDVPLIEDDVFRELHFGLTPAYPAKRFDSKGLVLHCGSFSKSLAPGLRLGWVAAGRYAARIEHASWLTTAPASVPAQCAIADYLEHGEYDRLLRKLRRELSSLQTRMVAAVVRYFPKGTLLVRPPGGFFLWVQLPEGVEALQLFEMAEAHEIAIAPGPIFSCGREFRRHIRLNYGRPWTSDVEKEIHTLGMLARRAMAEQRTARHARRERGK
ncbi:PLP-dependent aminotransferase family protein [Paraburkholderia sabiae]|uniref:PLP-dependent aminotransferase family protein n=1 Tax=Paraburkholderia sabiae TaxID=273251 RepID=A0ABU9QKA0_9BURK|nr:PLP-dependent aminotransferase family protein [Paraburkholderia sabiae]WJZ76523.1 PLP-dependent aminotransferase family protein [Paraburkholderia sabiae]CAD6560329.1 HTH-type transcriptional regulator NorG [Paraburkholderia sabiae]